MRRTKAQAAETGLQILRAAEGLFLEKGYDNVSLEEIAAASGVTRGAVHWHFKNKQGLLLALRDDAQQPFRALADRLAQDSGAASLEELGRIIGDMFAQLQDDPRRQGLLRVMMRLDFALSEDENGSTFREDIKGLLISIFQAVARRHKLPEPWTAESAASALSATIGGLVSEWALGRGQFRLAPEGQFFIKMLFDAWSRQG